jgi:hypothetical protein
MSRKWIVAVIFGIITTTAVLAGGIWALISRPGLTGGQILFHVSVAFAPLAMVSVMVGFGVWWMIMFLLTLFSSEQDGRSTGKEPRKSHD